MSRLAVLSLLIALMLPATASAALPNACTLLTNAEVAKVFGAKIENRSRDRTRLSTGCTWDGASPNSFTSYHASLRIDIAHVTKAEFEKRARKATNAVRVHGVGELAYSQYVAGEFLSVWQHGVWMGVELTGGLSPITAAKTLARAALNRL